MWTQLPKIVNTQMNMTPLIKQIPPLTPQGGLSSAHPLVKNLFWNQTRRLFRIHNDPTNFAWIKTPLVDFFVYRLSYQLPKYVMKRPDFHFMATNWFTITWSKDIFYKISSSYLKCWILNKVKKSETKKLILITDIGRFKCGVPKSEDINEKAPCFFQYPMPSWQA